MGKAAERVPTSAAAARYRRKRTKGMPAIFGTRARTEMLAVLAVNGPTHVREIARLRGVDASSTFRAIDRLIKAGLVAKRDRKKRHVALDRSHRGQHELEALLRHLDERWPVPRNDQPRYRYHLPLERTPRTPPDLHTIFGSVTRTRVLLILGVVESANLNEIAAMCHLTYGSATYALNGLEIEGIVATRGDGTKRVAELAPRASWTPLLRRYIRRVVRLEFTEYRDLAWLRDAVDTLRAY